MCAAGGFASVEPELLLRASEEDGVGVDGLGRCFAALVLVVLPREL